MKSPNESSKNTYWVLIYPCRNFSTNVGFMCAYVYMFVCVNLYIEIYMYVLLYFMNIFTYLYILIYKERFCHKETETFYML